MPVAENDVGKKIPQGNDISNFPNTIVQDEKLFSARITNVGDNRITYKRSIKPKDPQQEVTLPLAQGAIVAWSVKMKPKQGSFIIPPPGVEAGEGIEGGINNSIFRDTTGSGISVRITTENGRITTILVPPGYNKKNEISSPPTSPKETFSELAEIGMKFVRIDRGSFMMGSPIGEKDRRDNERQHRVTLTKGFSMGVHEVTQKQWQAVMGNNPSQFKGDDLPVETVSWFDAIAFCNALSTKFGKKPYYSIKDKDVTILGGSGYRLPTEAEWEYACRAGSTTAYSFGDNSGKLSTYAWYFDNSSNTRPVRTKSSNVWGLHDMHGNVWEWCWDWHGNYPTGEVTDPQGPNTGQERVLRGGCWYNTSGICRSAARFGRGPNYFLNCWGVRVCCYLD
jgi:formylglycine-generating enzyme required for sulfatase activity